MWVKQAKTKQKKPNSHRIVCLANAGWPWAETIIPCWGSNTTAAGRRGMVSRQGMNRHNCAVLIMQGAVWPERLDNMGVPYRSSMSLNSSTIAICFEIDWRYQRQKRFAKNLGNETENALCMIWHEKYQKVEAVCDKWENHRRRPINSRMSLFFPWQLETIWWCQSRN